MRVLVPSGIESARLAHPLDERDFETINLLIDGTARATEWIPIRMTLVTSDSDGSPLAAVDAPWLGSHALVFGSRVVDRLGPLLRANGELLPLRCDREPLWMFNPPVVDAIDESRSKIVRFADGRPMRIKSYAFRADAVASHGAFKIPTLRVSPTFVSQQFAEAWRDAHLTGLDFRFVWAPD